MKKTEEAHEKTGQKIETLTEQLGSAKEEMERLRNTTGTSAEALQAQQKTIDDLEKQLRNAEKDYLTLGNKITDWNASLNNANADELRSAEDRAVYGGSESIHRRMCDLY